MAGGLGDAAIVPTVTRPHRTAVLFCPRRGGAERSYAILITRV